MFKNTIEVKGLDKVIKSFGNRAEELVGLIDYAVKITAEEVSKNAKKRAPRLTGALRRSIIKYQIDLMIWAVGSDVPYARVRNYINKKNPQTVGYLTNSLFEQRGTLEKQIDMAIKKLKQFY